MRIACVVMQKNEVALLRPWVEYHAALCGIENLYVLDNESTHPDCLRQLREYEERGLNVDYSHVGRRGYAEREAIVTKLFHELGETGRYDFLFPLDADEFLAVHQLDGTPSTDPDSIRAALSNFLGDPRVLTISGAYDNIPTEEDLFIPSPTQRKSFFASGQCKRLGLGYHVSEALHSEETVQTPITYFHIHNRPYHHYRYAAYEKLLGRVPDFSGSTLRKYAEERREGFHLVSGFLMHEAEYAGRFNVKRAVRLPQLGERLAELSAPLIFRPGDVPDIRRALRNVSGYSESAVLTDEGLNFTGWSLVSGSLASEFRVLVNRAELELDSSMFKRTERPDVRKVHPDAPLDSGFALLIPRPHVPPGVQSGHSVVVQVRDPDTNVFVPLVSRCQLTR